ncbi:toll/interleukin-1 receptor domain-containing protein [Actinokineospora sp. NPDC004072]
MATPITVFLSYAQIDDEGLGFVKAFRKDLEFYCSADHGRRVEVFYDRTSLGWGDEWRTGISTAIEGALVFLPLVTLTYFQRPWCREELLQFYSSANTRGVVDLLLPVVVLGHSQIRGDSEDIAVRIIADRQQFDFRAAAIEGPGTAQWRGTMTRLAGELVAAVNRAEQRLAPAPGLDRAQLGERMAAGGKALVDVLVELVAALHAYLPELERAAELVADPALRRERAPRVAAVLLPGGAELERHGTALEKAAVELDGSLRAYYDLVMTEGSRDERARLVADLSKLSSGAQPLQDMSELCGDFLDLLRPAETTSVPMRHALEPTRRGFLALQSAVGIIHGWTRLAR